MNSKLKIGVIGAGGWGSALSILLADHGHFVNLWSHESHIIDEINLKHTNETYLPGSHFPEQIKASTNPDNLSDEDIVLMAIPTQFIRSVLNDFKFNIQNKTIVAVAKGIERHSLMRVSEIIKDVLNQPDENYVIISGPSHAEEVVRKMPTTVVAASVQHSTAHYVQNIFTTPYFRVYTSDDVIGCEIGGSLKNVIAIAAGVIDGLGLGDNTKAALITRGLAEISRLGVSLGANPITFSGLSGLGDLYVTCSSKLSRNRFVGDQLGQGKKLKQITAEMIMIAEGIYTTESAFELAQKKGVEVPIIEQMYNILFKDYDPSKAILELMTRKTKKEWWW